MKQNTLLFLDFETYYDDEYSLRKMPIPNYILDPRYQTIMCAVKEDNNESHIVDGPDFPEFIKQYDPSTTTTVAFNALFDNAILAWRYGFIPARMLDSMGMVRALRGHILKHGASLAAVAKALGFAPKGGAIAKVKGLNRDGIQAAGLWEEFCAYANHDNELNAAVFFRLIEEFPKAERRLMDLVLRCGIEPVFNVDTEMLAGHIEDVKAAKDDLILEIGMKNDKYFFLSDESKAKIIMMLQSAKKFGEELESLGVEVEYKYSLTTGKQTPCFARTDEFMTELSDHPDPRVQSLVAARLGHKSTIEETRAEKLLSIGRLQWPAYCRGNMPMPLAYGRAHTHRFAGEWGMNVQNLPTARSSKGKSKLRRSLLAPGGHVVLTADLGQIEARLVAWICKCDTLLKQFAGGGDPYNFLASRIFGFPVDRKVHVPQGFIGKTGILGLGYGCGYTKFDMMIRQMSRAFGIDLTAIWYPGLAHEAVTMYRETFPEIPAGWRKLDYVLEYALMGSEARRFGPCLITHGKVEGPNGLCLNYADLQIDEHKERTYAYGKTRHKIYGAKLLENIVQFLARIVVTNAALRLDTSGYRFVLQAHDELVFIVPKDDVDNAKAIVRREMTRPPSWAPDLPLTADIGIGASYGEAK